GPPVVIELEIPPFLQVYIAYLINAGIILILKSSHTWRSCAKWITPQRGTGQHTKHPAAIL
ncbi:hypothetical protein KI387_008358, partial [Taxus chinensis]